MSEALGLALGGGAVHGAAHVGVLRALHEHDIIPNLIAGTSIGAMVAALYAFGVDLADIEKGARGLKWMDISRLHWNGLGLMSNEGIADVIHRYIPADTRIEEAQIPLAIVTVDIASGEKVVLREGDLATAVAASTAIPGIFSPVRLGERFLIDGGLIENVPVSALRDAGAKRIIAVDLSARERLSAPDSILDVITNAVSLSIKNASRQHLQGVDLVIEPDVDGISAVDVEQVPRLIELGYEAANLSLKSFSRSGLLDRLRRSISSLY